jgi:hypothetical protein
MRRIPAILALIVTISAWLGAQQPPSGPATPAKPPTGPMSMLTVDSIMRGPKLVGTSPTAVRWSKDSSKIYFTWQKAGDDQSGTYVVNKDGTGLRRLNTGETPEVPAVTGRLDRARKRAVSAEGGDIVITDVATGTRRVLTRTSAAESNPRWVRNDTAVTFMRDGNLYLMSVTASEAAEFAQLTDVVAAPQDVATAGAPAGAGAGQRGGAGAGGATGGRGGGNGRGGQAQEN